MSSPDSRPADHFGAYSPGESNNLQLEWIFQWKPIRGFNLKSWLRRNVPSFTNLSNPGLSWWTLYVDFFDRCHGSTEQCVECQSRMKSLPVYSLITGSPNSDKLPFKRVTPLMNKGLINPDLRLSIAFEHGLVSIPMDCYHVPHQIAIWGAYPKFKRNKHLKSVVYISHHILQYGIPIEPLFIG